MHTLSDTHVSVFGNISLSKCQCVQFEYDMPEVCAKGEFKFSTERICLENL